MRAHHNEDRHGAVGGSSEEFEESLGWARHDGPIADWILASGLIQEELARIQAPAVPVRVHAFDPSPVARAGAAPIKLVTVEEMKAGVRAHIGQVETELREGQERSLDTALERYVASRTQS